MPDVIITVGPSPLGFMIEKHKTAFPGVPVIFCLPNRLPGGFTADSDFTGVDGDTAPAATLEAALRLVPGTKRVVVVGGTSSFDRQQSAAVREQLKPYEKRLDISYLADLAMPELLERWLSCQVTQLSCSPLWARMRRGPFSLQANRVQ